MQKIFIAIDDSGKLIKEDVYMCFAGILFFNENEKNEFIKKYKRIVDSLKCYYCKYKNKCNNNCPELKHYILKNSHKKLFIDFLRSYHLFSCAIDIEKIYKNILNKPKAKGRFLDYAIKIMIKNIVKSLIKENKINPDNNLEIFIDIDEKSYKSNGYYNLEESISKELKQGIGNIKNNIQFKNVINGNLKINVSYRNSKQCYLVQASDLIVGYVRKSMLLKSMEEKDKRLRIIDYQTFLP